VHNECTMGGRRQVGEDPGNPKNIRWVGARDVESAGGSMSTLGRVRLRKKKGNTKPTTQRVT